MMIDKTGQKGSNLIFLISQPRSGSTLLQLILKGHPEITSCSEPWIALHPVYALRSQGFEAEYDEYLARIGLKEFLKFSNTDEQYYKEQIADMLLSLYGRALKSGGGGKYFLDKTPRYYEVIEDLAEMFPGAKFIILLRNPLAVLSSILKTWVKENWALLPLFKRDLVVAPQKLGEFIKNHPKRCFAVKYEDMLMNTAEIIARICDYLDIDFKEEMLNYRTEPDWRLGDHKAHDKKQTSLDSLYNWQAGFPDQKTGDLARSYLKSLGPTRLSELGYDYDELQSGIGAEGSILPRRNLWSLVMSENIWIEKGCLLDYKLLLRKGYQFNKKLFLHLIWLAKDGLRIRMQRIRKSYPKIFSKGDKGKN